MVVDMYVAGPRAVPWQQSRAGVGAVLCVVVIVAV